MLFYGSYSQKFKKNLLFRQKMFQELLSSRKAKAVTLTALLSVVPSAAEAKKPEYPLRPIPAVSYSIENPKESNYLGLTAWTEPTPKLGSLNHLLIMASPQPKRPCYLDYGEECLKGKQNEQAQINPSDSNSPKKEEGNSTGRKVLSGALLTVGIASLVGAVWAANLDKSKYSDEGGTHWNPNSYVLIFGVLGVGATAFGIYGLASD